MKKKRLKTEREIDEAVIANADDNEAWEKPVRVKRDKGESVSLPAEIAARAAFFWSTDFGIAPSSLTPSSALIGRRHRDAFTL